jgi:hypothetical protein
MNERPLIWLTIGTLPAMFAAVAAHRQHWWAFAAFVVAATLCAVVAAWGPPRNTNRRNVHARHAIRRDR